MTPTTVTIPRDAQVEPNNYMALAIFVTICCFLPTGIAAIVFSSRVSDLSVFILILYENEMNNACQEIY